MKTKKNLDELERAYKEAIEAERNYQPTNDINADRARLIKLWNATNKAFEAYHTALREAIGG